jgi:hypothetical protein
MDVSNIVEVILRQTLNYWELSQISSVNAIYHKEDSTINVRIKRAFTGDYEFLYIIQKNKTINGNERVSPASDLHTPDGKEVTGDIAEDIKILTEQSDEIFRMIA